VVVNPSLGDSFRVPSLSKHHHRDPRLLAFGQAIREIRASRGISQEQLALQTGLDRSYMGGVERGDNNVTLLKAHVIAKTLGLTLSELMASAKL
jgi:transcriptional regulator with XRE-family HTH domain